MSGWPFPLNPKPPEPVVEMWMYYETDGDSGYYGINIFSTREKAEAYKKKKHSAYGGIDKIIVDRPWKPPY